MVKKVVSQIIAVSMVIIISVANIMPAYAGVNDIKNSITNGAKDFGEKATEAQKTATKVSNGALDKAKETATQASKGVADATNKASSVANDVGKNVSDKAKQGVNKASEIAGNVGDSVMDAVGKIELPEFKKGWDYAAQLYNSKIAAQKGTAYVNDVQKAIETMKNDINVNAQASRGIPQEAGFAAERWHADTFNIDAVAKGSNKTASTLESNARGSVDVAIKNESNASLKYYSTAEGSAKAQAESIIQKYNEYCATAKRHGAEEIPSLDEYVQNIDYDGNKELYWSMYQGQVRIIPADQYDDAQKYLKKLIAKEKGKEGPNRAKVASGYEETLEKLATKLESKDGTSSIPLTKEEAEAIAKVSQENGFEPSEFGVSASKVIKPQYVVKQAMSAGTQSAAINIAIVTGPEIYQIIKTLIEDGELNEEQLKTTGFDALSAGSEGFLEGAVSNAILVACVSGKFGTQFKNASPDVIGSLTVISIEAAKYGYQMSQGKITADQYADYMAEDIFIAAASLGTGALVQMLLPMVPGAYFAGSMAGSMLGSVGYEAGRDVVLEIKNNGGMDMIVASAQNTEKEVQGKVCAAQTTITKALSNMNFKPSKDFNIKIYDLVSK